MPASSGWRRRASSYTCALRFTDWSSLCHKILLSVATCLILLLEFRPPAVFADDQVPKYKPDQVAAAPAFARPAGGPDEDLRTHEPAKFFGVPSTEEMMVSPGTTVGETYYDYQHNCSAGRQVDKFGNNIQVTYMRQSLPQISPGRKVFWNRVAVTGSASNYTLDNGGVIRRLPLGTPATPLGVEVGPEDQQGYTNLRLLPNGRAAAFYHAIGALGTWAVATDSAANAGLFKPDYEYPAPAAPVTDPAIWPHGATDVVGTDTVLHVVAQESSDYEVQNLYYWRGVLTHPGGGSVGMTWSGPWVLDSLSTISAVVEADPTSDRVAIVYARPREAGVDYQWDNDVVYRLSTDGGLSWGSPINITNYTYYSEQRAYCDVAAVYDGDGTLHIVYNTQPYSISSQWLPTALWHWNDARGSSRMIAAAYWKNTCSTVSSAQGGGWNAQIAKPAIAVKPAGAGPGSGNPDEVLYVAWVQFGPTETDCATSSDGSLPGGWVNSEIWCSASNDDGLTWDKPQNVTGTETPDCAPGDCHSEHWVTAAARADSGLYLSYVDDTHAGGIAQDEGGWSLSPYKVLALEARAPSVSPRMVVLPVEPAQWTSYYWANEIELTSPTAGVNTDQIRISNPGNAQLNFTATIINNGESEGNPLVNGLEVYNGSLAPGAGAETLTVSYDAMAAGYLDFDLQITSNALDVNRTSANSPSGIHWKWGSALDRYWQSVGTGTTGLVLCLTEYSNNLIAGGFFPSAGGVPGTAYIAAYDGTSWSALGTGLGGVVRELTVYDYKLIAGGGFTSAGGNPAAYNIASWDGTAWSPLGLGTNSEVSALTVYNGKLIAGGWFTSAGGNPAASYIASWDGTAWSPLGLGTNGPVYALTVYNGKLIAGGSFNSSGGTFAINNIASWDGTAWSPLDLGTNSSVAALAVYNGKLIAGGDFTAAGDAEANKIALWDGTGWSALGSGITTYWGSVSALTAYGGKLIAGGGFTEAGGIPASYIASWDGTTWSALGSGTSCNVYTLMPLAGRLYVGGCFGTTGQKTSPYIASWTPPDACLTVTSGDVNVDGSVTSADIVALVAYVFKGGPPPRPCEAAGDADCNGAVTSADVIYLVNHVFKSQPPPCDACTSALASGC